MAIVEKKGDELPTADSDRFVRSSRIFVWGALKFTGWTIARGSARSHRHRRIESHVQGARIRARIKHVHVDAMNALQRAAFVQQEAGQYFVLVERKHGRLECAEVQWL